MINHTYLNQPLVIRRRSRRSRRGRRRSLVGWLVGLKFNAQPLSARYQKAIA
jgi:hypothetical protein